MRRVAGQIIAFAWLAVLPAAIAQPSAQAQPGQMDSPPAAKMQVYHTRYYDIHTDLQIDDVREAALRMTRMFEEYRLRTRGFSGEIRRRLPFYLFRSADDYYDAGGLPGSAGVFNGTALMAIAGEHATAGTWHVVQHEGFHQFAAAVIRGKLPIWLNEGLAEYFGESLFTGDRFISGAIPPGRLKRVKSEIRSGKFKSIREMMLTGREQWNRKLTIANYDQAWSMVHFLAHGDGGKYQTPFVGFMQLIGRGVQWPRAWRQTFGDAGGFEDRWKDWWLNLPSNPTALLYAQADAATMTSFLGRALAHKQRFDTFADFLAAADAGTIRTGDTLEDWLPPSLLRDAASAARRSKVRWSIEHNAPYNWQLDGLLPDGTRIIGTCIVRGNQFAGSNVETDDTAAIIAQAQSLIDEGKRQQARLLLRQALAAHPHSPAAPEARKLMREAE